MPGDKKTTKEDTWRPAELGRYIREEERDDGYARRPADNERRQRGGESTVRHHRNTEKESGREREKVRESTRERRTEDKKDRYAERRKEESHDRRDDKERDRREEQEREKRRQRDRLVDENKYSGSFRENREKGRNREDKYDRERDRERHRDKDKERVRDGHREEERDKTREDRDKERRREERDRDREHRSERRRHEESRDGRREHTEKQTRDRHHEREQHKNEDKRNDKEVQQRHKDRKHSEWREARDYKEEHQKHKEERDRRHKERGHHDEKQKHDSREHRDSKRSGEEVRLNRGDGERRQREYEDRERKHSERGYKEEDDGERKHRERRLRTEEEDGEKKHRERRHGEEDGEKKYKETRHRAEDDQERNNRDRTSSNKSSSVRSHKPENNMAEKEEVEMASEQTTAYVKDDGHTEDSVVNDEEWANEEYEDDFEDYEEDFEEMDESASRGEDDQEPLQPLVGEEKKELTAQQRKELEAIQRAMDAENERVDTTHSKHSMSREEEDWPQHSRGFEKSQSRASNRGKFIDFVAAKHREVSKKVATKQKKRSTELLRLIDLDFSLTFSLLDLPPVNEYDMYIRSFGTANTKQAYVQCNEDNTERDIQTDETEMCEKWTQHPPEHIGACGDPNLSQEARDRTISDMNLDSQRLTSFLRSASQVMVVLLEEDQAERKSLRTLRTQTDVLSFSDGSLQLNTKLPFLIGRQISLVHFSQVQRHTMMSVHMPKMKPGTVHFDSCTLICIWNIWEPSRPQKILVYESEVQCCCFSPGKAILVFAGTSVGSVVLWDLREPSSNHDHVKIEEDDWTFRHPTFSTDAVMAASGHFSAVTSVEVVPSIVAGGPEVPILASEEESSGLSFQLASLDESGVLNFWVVVELPKGNEAGSPTDLGLWPGGRVKLLHSSSLLTAERVSPRDVMKTRPSQTLLLKFLPTDSNHFFIGTNMGLVNHGTTHGLKAPPKCYRFQEAIVRPVDVSSINFSPFGQHLFLVGCADGNMRLHAVSHEQPVAEWINSTAGESVLTLQWSQTRPTVFCVLDAASNLHIWDLLKNDTQPVVTEKISHDRVTAMAVFGDSGQQNTYSGIALAHESGKIEMHYFTRSFTASTSADEEKLQSLMA
ncbi:WD repeat-containing protein 60 [Parambassis ranga]|uniref:WD repeat-containing protein 60 n=1 Tax=Parambassis ranga TaxID=210632 RepID=A0A6P7KM09_9TELE|nr:WD repeat-containing protein 60 [Parambassis ranga]